MKKAPQLVFYNRSTLLEGPVWSKSENSVYCVSIEQCCIYKIELATGTITTFKTRSPVGCVFLENKNCIISAEKKGLFKINLKTGKRKFLVQLNHDSKMRYNDGKIDMSGRILVGTKGFRKDYQGKGKVFSFKNSKVKTIISETTISNGMGFSKNGKYFYFIDSPLKKVMRFHYFQKTGQLKPDRFVVKINGSAIPDGMCVDQDDKIWVAEWGGGKVCKWDPETGKKLKTISMPCKYVTSCCIGGAKNNYLFVTTAKKEAEKHLLAGGLFQVKIR